MRRLVTALIAALLITVSQGAPHSEAATHTRHSTVCHVFTRHPQWDGRWRTCVTFYYHNRAHRGLVVQSFKVWQSLAWYEDGGVKYRYYSCHTLEQHAYGNVLASLAKPTTRHPRALNYADTDRCPSTYPIKRRTFLSSHVLTFVRVKVRINGAVDHTLTFNSTLRR